jgi:hypothetical protein
MRKTLIEKTLKIPKGFYCYNCPFYSHINLAGVTLPFCEYLNKSSVPLNITNENWNNLKKYHGSTDAIFENHPLDLLWDRIKECGENY